MDLLSWLMHPAMLAAGAVAVSLPIIIHLLNRRRFRIIEWAAMDFLLEADRKNRRRVQVENLILLALRCLAMLLLGLLLARPFMPGMLAAILRQKQRIERVVLLDDSLSQLAVQGTGTCFQAAQDHLLKLLETSARATDSDNWVTLFVTSQPDQPLLAWEPVTAATLPALVERVSGLECTEQPADYVASLNELGRYLQGQRENTGRDVGLLTDLRQRDWSGGQGNSDPQALKRALDEIGQLASRCTVIDTAAGNDGNLAIVSVRGDDLLVANRALRFEVTVANYGPTPVNDVPVTLEIDGKTTLRDSIANIGAGRTEIVTFRHLFPALSEAASNLGSPGAENSVPAEGTRGPSGIRNHRVVASIDRTQLPAAVLQANLLAEDDTRGSAVRLLDGVPVLLVDGDPSPVPERSETHYLRNLDVLGTGLVTTVASPADLETISLAGYRVVFLCNVDEISADRANSLEQWVRDGGAVVFMPGNQVRAAVFNDVFWRNGEGLSPVALDRVDGDPTMASWVSFEPDSQVHPALRTILGSDATGLTRVDVFSWWKTLPLPEPLQGSTSTAIRLNDSANSPAMIDRSLGAGRVILFNIPADGDWTMWPAVTGSWVPVMLDLIDYLAGSVSASSDVRIGEPVKWPVDLSAYQSRVVLRDPSGDRTETVAKLAGTDDSTDTVLASATFDPVRRAGFHEVLLQRTTGEEESVLFSAGLPPEESRLRRISPEDARANLFGEKFELVTAGTGLEGKVTGSTGEVWILIVVLLLAVLACEQFLAWWFGRRRELAPARGGIS
jgi:Aerotolerance regulator N-terminal